MVAAKECRFLVGRACWDKDSSRCVSLCFRYFWSAMVQPLTLQLENVTKQFSPHLPPAVNDVSFELCEGDILGLLGPSGCGKTTLLRLIAGFECPQSGCVNLAGQCVANGKTFVPPERRDIGMVFQDYALFPHLTVMQNVEFGLKNRRRYRRFPRKQISQLATAAIALVNLQGLENRYPHELSGGQQQRVALARALAPQPALVLLDEPLSNLDVQIRLHLRQEVRDILKKTGTTAVFVTHDQEEALSMCDQVAVIRQGAVVQFGTPETIYQQPRDRFVAEFVTQANFLPAQWNGREWETEMGCFHDQLAADYDRPLAAKMDLMIRQEDLILEPDERGTVVIRDRQFLGREHRYCLISPSGRELHARSTASTPLEIGTRVKLSIAVTTPHPFPCVEGVL